jgi:cathepsin L
MFSLLLWASAGLATAMPFEEFTTRFNKNYADETEHNFRRSLYEKNLALIDAHNKRYEAGETSYKKGVNQFTDMSVKEVSQNNGYKGKHVKYDDQPCTTPNLDFSQALPNLVDWRNRDPAVLTPVKNQGQCGSCWAFATTETVEAAVAIASKSDAPTLAPQQVVSCTENPDQCGGTGGCQGATAELGFGEVKENGLCYNSDWPYTASTGQCHNSCAPAVNITGGVKLDPNNETQVMYALAQVGPVAVSVDASQWSAYQSGIYDGCSKEKYYDIDHAVQAVGYGNEDGKAYWIVRNSWGTSWGEDGYIRLARLDADDKDACKQDVTPGDGVACAGDTDPVTVCGECGIWYDNSYPTGAYYLNGQN